MEHNVNNYTKMDKELFDEQNTKKKNTSYSLCQEAMLANSLQKNDHTHDSIEAITSENENDLNTNAELMIEMNKLHQQYYLPSTEQQRTEYNQFRKQQTRFFYIFCAFVLFCLLYAVASVIENQLRKQSITGNLSNLHEINVALQHQIRELDHKLSELASIITQGFNQSEKAIRAIGNNKQRRHMRVDVLHGSTYGENDGMIFNDLNEIGILNIDIYRPKSIKLRCGQFIDAMQISYQTVNGMSHVGSQRGGNGGSDWKSFILDSDERIIKITGYAGGSIDELTLYTNKGRKSSSCGGTGGEAFTQEYPGYVLSYISGRAAALLHQIQFHWIRE